VLEQRSGASPLLGTILKKQSRSLIGDFFYSSFLPNIPNSTILNSTYYFLHTMLETLLTYLDTHWFSGNSITDYLFVWCIAIFSLGVLYIFRNFLLHKLKHLAATTEWTLDDSIIHSILQIPAITYVAISIYLASLYLNLSEAVNQVFYAWFVIVVLSQVGICIIDIIICTIAHYYGDKPWGKHTLHLVKVALSIVVRTIVVLLILNNLWLEITPLLTSLGIMSIAIAFAIQHILEDVFSSVSIYLDETFHIDDYIEVGEIWWTVTNIGIKTTRITTVRGEEIVIANRTLTDSMIHNYGKMDHRTITMEFMISPDTKHAEVGKIPDYIRELFINYDGICEWWVELVRVYLTDISGFWNTYKYRYTINTKDYEAYLQVQQQINLDILELFQKKKINLAKPAQKVLLD